MRKLKRFKKWLSKIKVSELKILKDEEPTKKRNLDPDVKIDNPDVIQGGAQKDTAIDTTVDPQWPITH